LRYFNYDHNTKSKRNYKQLKLIKARWRNMVLMRIQCGDDEVKEVVLRIKERCIDKLELYST
jgi:hypothetical protein